jgi:hypothetical protein
MFKEDLLLVANSDPSNDCIACCDETINITKCCRAPICKKCYLKWLTQKRQCMHCKADQCSFKTWFNNYRIEPDFDPQEYLHNLISNPPENQASPDFTISNFLNIIQEQLIADGINVNMEEPNIAVEPGNSFDIEYGYTTASADGDSITVSHSLEYDGNSEDYEQIQNFVQQYQLLFDQYTQTH